MFIRKKRTRSRRRLHALLLGLSVLLIAASSAYSQTTRPPTPPAADSPPSNGAKSDSSMPDFGSRESEMRASLALRAEKKQYDENLERAREASQLAEQLLETYEAKKLFNSEDGKKLERLEKLTKRIRNEAGGSENDAEVKDLPNAMTTAVKRLSELADDLRKLVEKTPRHVISAAVIDQANKLIGLVKRVRDLTR